MYSRNSELITWSNTFSCGVKLIDDQHKELVTMVNDMFLHVSGSEKEEQEYFSNVIHKIVNYVKVHFSTEEKIMRATKFDGYLQHKHVHDAFIINVIDAVNDINCGKHISLYSFTKYLKDWIFSHIAVMDKQYFEYFKRIASRKDDGRLSITPTDVNKASA